MENNKANRDEMIFAVQHEPELVTEITNERLQAVLDDERRFAEIKAVEREDIIRMRKFWSKWILISILAINIFDFFVITALGFGWITFPDGFVIPAFIADTLIKTLGLAVIVVHFLFNKDSV